jgi:pimeloyl-ACP methyl ester carboxylesterase
MSEPTFLLVHGSWHDGGCSRAVRQHLGEAGFRSLAPTLAGHERGAKRSRVTHEQYVASVLRALEAEPEPAVLVGHSFGGSVISRVAELRPEHCRRLVYYSAFVPRDGERVADSLPAEMLAFIDGAAAASADRSIALPYELFRGAFANTADEETAQAIYATLVPEPKGPIFEPLALPRLERLEIRSAYIACRQDTSLPPGSFHPGQSARLRRPRVIEIDGDHETLLTAPERLAWALLAAIGAERIAAGFS